MAARGRGRGKGNPVAYRKPEPEPEPIVLPPPPPPDPPNAAESEAAWRNDIRNPNFNDGRPGSGIRAYVDDGDWFYE
jgi:hypothetical protein